VKPSSVLRRGAGGGASGMISPRRARRLDYKEGREFFGCNASEGGAKGKTTPSGKRKKDDRSETNQKECNGACSWGAGGSLPVIFLVIVIANGPTFIKIGSENFSYNLFRSWESRKGACPVDGAWTKMGHV